VIERYLPFWIVPTIKFLESLGGGIVGVIFNFRVGLAMIAGLPSLFMACMSLVFYFVMAFGALRRLCLAVVWITFWLAAGLGTVA